MKEKIENLWVGADFFAYGKRWCLLEIHGREDECIATKIEYDEPNVTGNNICSFDYGELVEYCKRGNTNI